MNQNNSFVFIGKLTRPHGIHGEICAQYFAESFDYLKKNQILLKAGKLPPKPCEVKSFKEQGNILILKIQDINTRTEAELYRNYDIVIDEKLLTKNDKAALDDNDNYEDAPYLHHLLGATAFYNSQDLGKIEEIAFPAGQEIWFIRKGKTEILYPAVSQFIDHYDLDNNAVYLNPPAGLLEIYLDEETENKEENHQKIQKNTSYKNFHKK